QRRTDRGEGQPEHPDRAGLAEEELRGGLRAEKARSAQEVEPSQGEHEGTKERGERVEPQEHPRKGEVPPRDQQGEWTASRDGGCRDDPRENSGPKEELPGSAGSQHLEDRTRGGGKLGHQEEQGKQCRDDQNRSSSAEQERLLPPPAHPRETQRPTQRLT